MSFYQAKTKLRSVDNMFSKYIREKSGWKCEYCGKDCNHDKGYLTNSHYFGRRKESTRFDPRNTHALCRSCHFRLEDLKGKAGEKNRINDEDYTIWIKNKLGEDGFNKLRLDSNLTCKKDDAMTKLYIKQLVKELNQS